MAKMGEFLSAWKQPLGTIELLVTCAKIPPQASELCFSLLPTKKSAIGYRYLPGAIQWQIGKGIEK